MRAWAFVAGTVAIGCGGVFGVRSQIGNEQAKSAVERLRQALPHNSGEREQTGQQMADGISHGIKLAECLGFKVYSDPQPVGHPPSAAECADLQKESARIETSPRPPASSK
jgi:hypothetical protein